MILRAICIIIGIALMVMSSLLYPDEEGAIQNRLETWWKFLRNAEARAVNRHAAFVAGVAYLGDRFYDRLLGKQLFSMRAIGVSACFSLASLLLVCSPGLSTLLLSELPDVIYYVVIVALMVLGILPTVFGKRHAGPTEPKVHQKTWRVVLRMSLQALWVLGVLYLSFLVLIFMDTVNWFNLPYLARSTTLDLFRIGRRAEVLYYLAFIVLTVASDAVFIAVTRWLLRKSSKLDSRTKILGIMIGNMVLACSLVIVPVISAWGFDRVSKLFRGRGEFVSTIVAYVGNSNPRQTFLSTLGASNMLDGLVAATFFILLFGLLLHRLFWPIAQRPTYALASRGIVNRRRLFFFLGLTLVGLGGMPKSATKVLDKIFETLLGS